MCVVRCAYDAMRILRLLGWEENVRLCVCACHGFDPSAGVGEIEIERERAVRRGRQNKVRSVSLTASR